MKKLKSALIACIFLSSLVVMAGCCDMDSDCDDGEFCNGVESCTKIFQAPGGICISGQMPCDEGEVCDEEENECVSDGSETTTSSSSTTTSTESPEKPVIKVNLNSLQIIHKFGISLCPQDFEEDLIVEEQEGGDLEIEFSNTKNWLSFSPQFGGAPLFIELQFTCIGDFTPSPDNTFEDTDTITITGRDPNTGEEADALEVPVNLIIEF